MAFSVSQISSCTLSWRLTRDKMKQSPFLSLESGLLASGEEEVWTPGGFPPEVL